MEYEAVRLFVDRAAAALSSFALTEQNGPAVARVCRHLDGIPLAIELAAGRVRCLPVERIAQRLDDRFHLLTDGGRTALPRHRTLKGLIDWSYELLSEPERTLLRRLSVFVGGWTSEAAEAVCADCGLRIADCGLGTGQIRNPQSTIRNQEVAALLSALVEKSLVVFEAQDPQERYRFLETVRQYALDRLTESGEAVGVQERQRDWFLRLAEQAEAEHHGPQQSAWLRRLETEHDNLRAALDFSHAWERGRPRPHAEAELRLATALAWFWHTHNHWREGRQRLEGALARSENVSDPVRGGTPSSEQLRLLRGDPTRLARGRVAAGYLACGERDDLRAQALCEEGLAQFQELGDPRGAGWALYTLGLSTLRRDPARSAAYHEQALVCFQEVGDAAGIALAVYEQGVTAYAQRDFTRAAALIEDGLARLRAQGNTHFVADALGMLAYCRRQQGNLADARGLSAESLAIFRELGDRWGMAWTARHLAHVLRGLGAWEAAQELYRESLSLCQETARPRDTAFVLVGLADIALQQGDMEAARGHYREGLTWFRNQGSDRDIPWLLEKLAGLAAARGHGQRAARLLGAAEALRKVLGVPMPPADRSDYYERQLLTAHSLLSKHAFAAAWEEGRVMTPEQAIAEAFEEAKPLRT
jgi:predicted ATPase